MYTAGVEDEVYRVLQGCITRVDIISDDGCDVILGRHFGQNSGGSGSIEGDAAMVENCEVS